MTAEPERALLPDTVLVGVAVAMLGLIGVERAGYPVIANAVTLGLFVLLGLYTARRYRRQTADDDGGRR